MSTASITIGKLRDGLSAELRRVQAGQTLVVMDRDVPIARIIPFEDEYGEDAELRELVARGVVRPPKRRVTPGGLDRLPKPHVSAARALAAHLQDRDEAAY